MSIKEEIIAYSKDIAIEAIGFCSSKPVENAEEELKGAKTFIVLLLSYSIDNDGREVDHGNEITGAFSRSAIFKDYHVLMYEKLEKLTEFITNSYWCEAKCFCDISPFNDRELGVMAGLGTIGRNTFLINKTYGTATYIGYILTDLELADYDNIIQTDYCANCNKCVAACPNQAILGDRKLIRERCISQLTQLKALTDKMRNSMSGSIYGCDICQKVCPYNQETNNTKYSPIIESNYSINKLLSISNKEFKETIKVSSAGWKGKKILQRNAIIALGNNRTKESVLLLEEHMNDMRADIRMEIAKALIRINTEESRRVLLLMLNREEQENIQQVIKDYL